MKKCFLDNLPQTMGLGKNKDKTIINWSSSIGCTIPFVYKEFQGELKIVDYNSKKQKLKVEYNNEIVPIATSQILNGALGGVLKVWNKDYIYNIGQVLDKNGRGLVVEHLKKGKDNTRHYRIKCLDCYNEYNRSEGHLKERGVKCPCCGDGVSYPNKFITSLLLQLKCSFKREHIFDEIKDKRYDFYIHDSNSIVEVHGKQHYNENGFGKYGGRTLDEEQSNDELKKELALSIGITHYIVVNYPLP